MSRRQQLLLIISVVIVLTAAASHGLMAWLKIETSFGQHWVIGPNRQGRRVFVAGSSLAGDGIAWRRLSESMNWRIEGWGVAGSSPPEWEQYQPLATDTDLTILVVSPYDLNEQFLSDFRAAIVPLPQTAVDLWRSETDWSFRKRLVSSYPLNYLRLLYPTAGRSDGVIGGVREEFGALVTRAISQSADNEAGPTLSFDGEGIQDYKKETIANWSPGRLLRRLTELRTASQGSHAFNGPKRLAFLRMLYHGQRQGTLIIVVLPVSPPYGKEFMTIGVQQAFEALLQEGQRQAPDAAWIRLDKVTDLHSERYFWDLVHMNVDGQEIATKKTIEHIRSLK
jgi:hypothetical protein